MGTITSAALQTEFESALLQLPSWPGDVWFGFTDASVEGTWEWIDGAPVNYTHWDNGEPNQNGNEDCAKIINNNKQWHVFMQTCTAHT